MIYRWFWYIALIEILIFSHLLIDLLIFSFKIERLTVHLMFSDCSQIERIFLDDRIYVFVGLVDLNCRLTHVD